MTRFISGPTHQCGPTEVKAINDMLSVAAEHGLEGEVVREMVRQFNPEAGVNIAQACTNALVEWDL